MRNINIVRATKDREHPYVMVLRATVDGSSLTFEERGLLIYILGKPDNWQVQIKDLMREGSIGRDKAYNLVNGLIKKGYAERFEERTSGKVTGYRVVVHESPLPEKTEPAPLPEKPDTAEPDTVNQEHNKELLPLKKEREVSNDSCASAQPPQKAKPSLKSDAHPNTQPVLHAYLEVLDYTPASFPVEAKAAKEIAQAGYTPEDVAAAYSLLKSEPFWASKHLSLAQVHKQMPAMKQALLNGRSFQKNNGRRSNGQQVLDAVDSAFQKLREKGIEV